MNKEQFLELENIRVIVDAKNYFNADFVFVETLKNISDCGNFYHPWYRFRGEVVDFMDAFHDKLGLIAGVKLSEIEKVDLDPQIIIDIANLNFDTIHPIPIATDMNIGLTIMLDSNHTLSCLYRRFLQTGTDIAIPVVELKGNNLEDMFFDFAILKAKSLV
jgi:hypothetical protein